MKENNNDLHEFTSAAEKCTFNPHNTSRHVFIFFIWTVSFPATFDSTHISFLSLFSLMHAYTVGRAHTQKHTFRNLWPGRQSSFINFWVWVQYSVFLDSHLRAIINAGMLAEHPDLRHKYVVITVREEPAKGQTTGRASCQAAKQTPQRWKLRQRAKRQVTYQLLFCICKPFQHFFFLIWNPWTFPNAHCSYSQIRIRLEQRLGLRGPSETAGWGWCENEP